MQSSIGLTKQVITESETETRPEQPSHPGKQNRPENNREDQSTGDNKQQKEPTVQEVRLGRLLCRILQSVVKTECISWPSTDKRRLLA